MLWYIVVQLFLCNSGIGGGGGGGGGTGGTAMKIIKKIFIVKTASFIQRNIFTISNIDSWLL